MEGEPATPGDLIASRYRIAGRIGAGGMGVVYRAVDEQLRRPVALKFLSPSFARDTDRLGRFRNEAHTLSALNHPHIVTIYEIGEAAAPFIAMELVDGRTLRARLGEGRVPVRDAVAWTIEIARALTAAHERGIVHRDIKAENVMVRPDGYVKVLDFGVAVLRPAGDHSSSFLTASLETVPATVAGTPAYMSPEQLEGDAVDARSDLFSLGVLFCELVTGRNPFARDSVLETISAIQRTPAPAVQSMTDVPDEVRDVIHKTLQREPAARFQSASDLVAALRQVQTNLDVAVPMRAGKRPSLRRYAAAATVIIAASGAAAFLYHRSERRHWVREEAAPAIARLAGEDKSVEAYRLIEQAEQYLPDDPGLRRAVATATRVGSVHSTPPGAVVDVQDYLSPKGRWLRLGTTPLDHVRIPAGYLRWRVSTPGAGQAATLTAPLPADVLDFDLDAAARAPEGMVPVPGGVWTDSLAFVGWLGPYELPPFYIDKFEVTNRQYQVFVDKGGYRNATYWKEPFIDRGRELSWDMAIERFRDATGRPGPATWEGGHYPEGQGDYPVSGVSWFEAAAYAEFAGKRLPVIAQGYKAAPAATDRFAVALGNLSGTPAPAGRFDALGPFGTEDLIGNVREWYWNASGPNRFALGRQASSYGPEALSPFDRSPLNGFRCVRNEGALPDDTTAPRTLLARNFAEAQPAGEAQFALYRELYAYDRTPLNASLEAVPDSSVDWTRQKITINAAYGNERLPLHLFLPKQTKPPYQTVIFFPSARVNFLASSTDLGDLSFIDYVIKSGRAVLYPIYQGLYERHSGRPTLPGPTLQREVLIAWSKDLGRSIDYLESRPDIDTHHFAYLGVSQGSAYGVILAALEKRLQAVVLLDGGFFQQTDPIAGVDQADFAPRLTTPVLMVNGRFDATFPYDSAQAPLFRMLGTPAADKREVVFDTPHDVRLRRTDLVREVLAWLDKYLGRIN
jgi:hypothetical protein